MSEYCFCYFFRRANNSFIEPSLKAQFVVLADICLARSFILFLKCSLLAVGAVISNKLRGNSSVEGTGEVFVF